MMILQSVSNLITADNIPAEIKTVAAQTLAIHTGEFSLLNAPYPADYRSAIDELTGKIKKEILGKALEVNRGNKAAAARQLGISRYTLIRELKKLETGSPFDTATP